MIDQFFEGIMQYFKTFLFLAALSVLSFCGGDKVTQNESESTEVSQFIPLATMSVVDATPVNGNGLIDVTSIESVNNPAGGDQVVRITGTTGEDPEIIKHQFEIHYTLSVVDWDTVGTITMITHSWGTDLVNSIDGGISLCDANCGTTTINPELHTLVFNNQILDATTNDSTLQGTVVYP